jgi:alpha-beta hydrolase superfamily lysophospholipase
MYLTVTSSDGTPIAYERYGDGLPLILVVGAFNTRATGVPLAMSLASRHAVFTYDRRGRGDSGDTAPYAVEREIEDLGALMAAAGGAAAVFGYSSGANLALQAAARGLPITRLALYDAPYLVGEHADDPVDHAAVLSALVSAGRRDEAVEYFQSRLVGIPEAVIAQLRQAPFRPALEAMAHTLVYEAAILGSRTLPTGMAESVTIPTLVVAGGASPFMCAAARALVGLLPHGQAHILEGQGHDLDPSVLGPVLQAFLAPGGLEPGGAPDRVPVSTGP